MRSSAEVAASTAYIAAELNQAGEVAQRLSLAAKNARFVVYRAGDRAAGMTVITNYFGELAEQTIALVKQINRLAMQVAHQAVDDWREQTLRDFVLRAMQLNTGHTSLTTLSQIHHQVDCAVLEHQQRLKGLVQQLRSQLDTILEKMRAAAVVVISSRLEANQIGELRVNLEEMANDIQALATQIRTHAERASQQLNEVSADAR